MRRAWTAWRVFTVMSSVSVALWSGMNVLPDRSGVGLDPGLNRLTPVRVRAPGGVEASSAVCHRCQLISRLGRRSSGWAASKK
jgi:hypothetical protein